MTYPDDLLRLATELADLAPGDPRQACLKRSVSTAYYALFHLLIAEATLNWAHPELRSDVGCVFKHGKMKAASSDKSRTLWNANKTRTLAPASAQLLIVVETATGEPRSRLRHGEGLEPGRSQKLDRNRFRRIRELEAHSQ